MIKDSNKLVGLNLTFLITLNLRMTQLLNEDFELEVYSISNNMFRVSTETQDRSVVLDICTNDSSFSDCFFASNSNVTFQWRYYKRIPNIPPYYKCTAKVYLDKSSIFNDESLNKIAPYTFYDRLFMPLEELMR